MGSEQHDLRIVGQSQHLGRRGVVQLFDPLDEAGVVAGVGDGEEGLET